MKLYISFLLAFLLSNFFYAQNIDYSISKIPDSIKQNANAVIRFSKTDIIIKSQRQMIIETNQIITVYNKSGISSIDAIEYYDKNTSILDISAVVYNSFGLEIKKIKRKDFRDQAVIDGATMLSDNRVLYLDYTPTEYPFTIAYYSKITTSNTAFIPSWMPINDYFVGIEKSHLNVTFPNDLGFKKKELNFENFNCKKTVDNQTLLSYEVNNITAIKPENYSPSTGFLPKLLLGLEKFNLEGIDGNAVSWKEFGKWYLDKLLKGTTNLSEETKSKIKVLVGEETDPIKKAKIIYKYVQEKSRYISVQVGIGGWKPMLAKDVDRLGYGDCKALSNYTKALLDVVGVPSYNTILYGNRKKINIQSDFVSMQGNHMILSIPINEKNIFLECTSQTDPFSYQANFTDDRDVLIIKPDGGEIVHTTVYEDTANSQLTTGSYTINNDGLLVGAISMTCNGSQYGEKAKIETMLPTEREAYLKEYWENINNLTLVKTEFYNDKEKISFTQNITFVAENYAKNAGKNLIFVVNVFNVFHENLKKIRNRKTPFEIQRGFLDTDEIIINLPSEEYSVESIPQSYEFKSKFGEYKIEIIKKSPSTLLYKRSLLIKKGIYSNTEYEEYRLFTEQISRNDNAKIVLLKNQ